MAPLITREDALRLGELEDRAQIGALIERAWRARVERFADSTDMCSLVNAKPGGCAQDCGFCEHHSAGRWAGVAIVARRELELSDPVTGLPGELQAREARWIEATVAGMRVASV